MEWLPCLEIHIYLHDLKQEKSRPAPNDAKRDSHTEHLKSADRSNGNKHFLAFLTRTSRAEGCDSCAFHQPLRVQKRGIH